MSGSYFDFRASPTAEDRLAIVQAELAKTEKYLAENPPCELGNPIVDLRDFLKEREAALKALINL